MHGIRTLAIDCGLQETPTVKRVEGLVRRGILGDGLGRDLVSALSFFMLLRTRSQLRAIKTGAYETESIVNIGELSTRDRDLLRDAMRVVKQFREVIRNRYHLSLFP